MAEATNGVDAQQQTQQKPTVVVLGHSARNAAMEQIAQRQHQSLASEFQEFNEDTGEIAPPTGGDAGGQAQHQHVNDDDGDDNHDDDDAGAGGDAAAPAVKPASAPAAEETETIIVDGQEVAVPKSKIVEAGRRTLQKEAAADARLQQASELFRQAQQYATQVGLNAEPPNQGARQQSAPSGEDEQGQQQQQPRQAAIDPDALGAAVDQRLYQRDAAAAAKRFKEEFPDIVGNPMSMNWVVQQENQRLQQVTADGKPPGDPYEAYRAHGEAARAQLKAMGVQPAPSTTTENKSERKRNTVAVSGASVRTPAPQPDKPKSTSQIIADMRKGRHQRID